MFEKFRKSLKSKKNPNSPFKFKTLVAYVIFGAIILVFALFGITPQQMGSDLGGNAALVNGQAISVASFRRRFEMVQRNSNFNLDQFPAAQRELFEKELRRRTLEQMIMGEAIYQTAQKQGFRVADAQVRDAILGIEPFQDKGHFDRRRYEAYLQGTGQDAAQFELEIRKEIMAQKLQNLFASSHHLSAAAQESLKSLEQVELSFRYALLNPKELVSRAEVSSAQVDDALKNKEAEIKAEYEKRKIDYYAPEQVQAKHILIKVGEGQSEQQAQQKLAELKKELTDKNFSEMARKYSDDPGSKNKGGELGLFTKGRMVPAFEEAAFNLPVGKISDPVKTEFGYHVILVEKKVPGGQKSYEEVKREVAKLYLARQKVDEKLAALEEHFKKQELKEAEAALKELGVKWENAKDVSLASDSIPGLHQTEEALRTLASRRGQLGLVPEMKEWNGERFVFDLTSWKTKSTKEKTPTPPMMDGASERLAGDAFQKWVMSLNEKVNIERNIRLLE